MDYQTVFDVTTTSPNWRGLAGGAAFVVLGLLLWFYRHKPFPGRLPNFHTAGLGAGFAGSFLGFSLLWFTWAFYGTIFLHVRAVEVMQSGAASVAEGKVEDFDPMPASGHKLESFSVKGVRFGYSDYVETPGFHQTRSHCGPIQPGLQVRIHYWAYQGDPMILKLEVAD